MKKLLSSLLALTMLFGLVACNKTEEKKPSSDEQKQGEEKPGKEKDMKKPEDKDKDKETEQEKPKDQGQKQEALKGKVAMITDIGGINDESFNQSAWNGMLKLKERGVDVSYIESHKTADYVPNLEKKVDEKVNVIWGVGFLMQEDLGKVAKEYPEQMFALVDGEYKEGEYPNVVGCMFRAEESSFLVGYIAGYMTKSNKVGFILGNEGPVMFRFRYGFRAGVMYAAKEQSKHIDVLDVNIASFSDTGKAKATAQKMIADGADIIYHAAGGAGLGAIEAARDANIKAIGVDLDQNKLAPDNVITSALKNVHVAVEDISARILKGEKLGGKTIFFGLKEGGVGIPANTEKFVPKEILEKEKQIEQKIISGEIKIPITEEEYAKDALRSSK